MGKNLVVVESPSKAKTIKKYLGSNYIVKSSVGHVIDLPKSKLGIDLDNNFKPRYITVRGKASILKEIKTAYKKSSKIFLATDPDREGEAIAWHLKNALGLEDDAVCRIAFNEITKASIKEAIKHPVVINQDVVDAQQARRVLDRIVGYKLSPLLWKKVKKGLSAGRVQSVALHIIIDREKEIDAFDEKEYWTIEATFSLKDGTQFKGDLLKFKGKKLVMDNEESTKKIIDAILKETPIIGSIVEKEKKKNPLPPFITSTMQQRAAQSLNFISRKTMQIAQQLYEGVDLGKENGGLVGLITYIRTDSTRISPVAKEEVKEFLLKNYGQKYIPEKPRYYKMGNKTQDAHEAIRPTSIFNTPEKIKKFLSKDQFKLYQLIWKRFLSSEMPSAIYNQVTIEILCGEYFFKSIGSKLKFDGFIKVMTETKGEDKWLPIINKDGGIAIDELEKKQHFTQPPPRFTEASLIKQLESLGIGRPSTYATILDTITLRGYVIKEKKQFFITELGFLVGNLLKKYFEDIINVKFTSKLENDLDLIAEGKREWHNTVKEFYEPFSVLLEHAEAEIEKITLEKESDEVTDVICEKCGRNMVIKTGRYGKFLACPGFPECRNAKPLVEKIGVLCPECNGEIVVKRSKKGRIFYGCDQYPECEVSFWNKPVNEKCPECGALLIGKKNFLVCSNEGCKVKKKRKEKESEE